MNRKTILINLLCLMLFSAISRAETYDLTNDHLVYTAESQLADDDIDISSFSAANVGETQGSVSYGYIGDYVKVVYVPKSVRSVKEKAFSTLHNTVLIFEDATDLEIGSNAFAGRRVEDIYFLKGETRSIPKTTRPLYKSQTITLGREVTKINNLESYTQYNVYCPNPPQLSDDIINNFSKYEGQTIHITKEATLAYFSDPYWSRFTLINDLVLYNKMSLSPDTKALKIGDSFTVSVNKTYPQGTDFGLYVKPNVLWSSNNEKLTYQDMKAKAVAPGEVDIIAFNIDRFDTCHVFIESPELSIDTDDVHLNVGESATVTATVTPQSAASAIEYFITDDYIASNDKGVITALSPGVTFLIVKCYDQEKRCRVEVNKLPPNVISITEDRLTLKPTDAATLTATSVRAVDKFILTNTDKNIAVASITNTYSDYVLIRITALRPGKTTVTVTSSDSDVVPAQCEVMVLGAIGGDVNGDGSVNTGDVSTLYKAILEGSTDTIFDVNGDGTVNAGDISELYKSVIGASQGMPRLR